MRMTFLCSLALLALLATCGFPCPIDHSHPPQVTRSLWQSTDLTFGQPDRSGPEELGRMNSLKAEPTC